MTPVLTKMTQEIEERIKELTHQVHQKLLNEHLDQLKSLTPSLISAIKIYILSSASITKNEANQSIYFCIEENKQFLIKRLTNEINEIIRVLQLKTYDQEESINESSAKKPKLVIF